MAKRQKFRNFPQEFKLPVIPDMRECYLGYGETACKYYYTDNRISLKLKGKSPVQYRTQF